MTTNNDFTWRGVCALLAMAILVILFSPPKHTKPIQNSPSFNDTITIIIDDDTLVYKSVNKIK